MPRKKVEVRPKSLKEIISSVKWTESYTSLLMGVIVVIVAVLFVVSFLKQTHHIQETSSTNTVNLSPTPSNMQVTSELKPSPVQKTYTVEKGDDLWHIAEKFYKSGYNYVDIVKANHLSDPGMIFSGNQLIIPNVTPMVATVEAAPSPTVQSGSTIEMKSNNSITSSTYIVQRGDTLWDIAVRAYADGYQWTKIAQTNNLLNPNLIFSGNILKIPR